MNSYKWLVVTPLLLVAHFSLTSWLVAQEKAPTTAASRQSEGKIALHDGWSLETSAKVEAKGEVISTPQFSAKGWHEVTVPTTVVDSEFL